MSIHARTALLLVLPLVLAAPRAARAEDEQEALVAVERRLEDAPEDPRLLEEAGLAALAAGDADKGLWYLHLALERAGEDEEFVQRVTAAMKGVEQPEVDADALLADYAETLFKLAKSCSSKKLYANAVDLLGRCRGTRFEEDAEERLEKIYQNDKAVAALLATGLDVPTQARVKLKPKEIARLDAKHATWENAYEIKGKSYTVKSNMGYEMAHSIANTMEQMNAFYRQVFGYKERGGGMRRCVINVLATRAEFDELGDHSPGVKGFFRPGENSVTTYDPRTEPKPRALSNLWSTLFHEASHQFTDAVWPNPIPTWLNEGTASYFEGARLQPNGKVAFNGIPDGRLKGAVALIGRGSPTVEEVITYFEDGSYPGDYYPIGWALVFFCHNYEDEDSERVYLPIYRAFMQTYKSGGNHDVKGRFVEYFVDKAKVDGVDTFDDFVTLWQGWIRNLAKVHFGDESQADVLIARARKQTADDKPEQAIESYRWALRKRPDDPVALAELAEVLADEKHGDGAMYSYRRLATLARAVVDPEDEVPGFPDRSAKDVLTFSLDGIAAVNARVAEGLGQADAAFVEASSTAARTYAEAGLPRSAVQLLATSQAVIGGDGALSALADELAEGIDLRRWRRLDLSDHLDGWNHNEEWKAAGDTIALDTDGIVSAIYRETPPASFRYEAAVHFAEAGEFPVAGLAYGSNPASGERLFVILPDVGVIGLVEFIEGVPEMTDRFDVYFDTDAPSTTLAIEVRPGHVDFFVDGEFAGEVDGGNELVGRVGLFGQMTEAVFEDVRLRY